MEKRRHRKGKIVLIILACIIAVLAIIAFIFLKITFLKSFPKLTGEPEVGKWYDIKVDGARSSDGSEWHGIFKKGTENKKGRFHDLLNVETAFVSRREDD